MSTYSAEEISELSKNLGAVEDWLRDHCEARHADDMADLVEKAVQVLEDLYDEAIEREK
jgi:hypothetical protein